MSGLSSEIFSSLDTRLVIGIGIVMVVLCVIALVKKLISVAVTTGIIVVVCIWLVPLAQNFQEKYNFRVDVNTQTAYMTVEGVETELNKRTLENAYIEVESIGGETRLKGDNIDLEIPRYMVKPLQSFGDVLEIDIEEIQK